MNNADRRRASGAANEAARRAGDGAAARRAIGEAMTERRTGKAQVDEINALVSQPRQRKQLKTITPRGALPAQTSPGISTPTPVATGGGGGIASPLTEKTKIVDGKTVPDATYWPAGYTSSDGLFVLPARKTERFTDANGFDVVFERADPQGVTP